MSARTADPIQEAFERFHARYPDVYWEIVRIAKRLRAAGRSHYSIDAIIQVVRYHRDLSAKDDAGFRLNNNFRSRYARMVMANEPELEGFFETRRLTSGLRSIAQIMDEAGGSPSA